jgi:hypothetical protein
MDIKKLIEQGSANQSLANAAKEAMSGTLSQSLGQSYLDQMRPIEMPQLQMPEIYRPPTQEEVNEYQSASVFMNALANSALEWKTNLPEGFAPAILAVLYGGIQIHVTSLSQVSFHGIQIEGKLNGSPCSMLAHQSTVQVLCFAEEVTDEKPKNTIGFVWPDNRVDV